MYASLGRLQVSIQSPFELVVRPVKRRGVHQCVGEVQIIEGLVQVGAHREAHLDEQLRDQARAAAAHATDSQWRDLVGPHRTRLYLMLPCSRHSMLYLALPVMDPDLGQR